MEELHNQEMQKRKQMELRQEEEHRRREEEMRMHTEERMRRQQEGFKGNFPGNVSPCFLTLLKCTDLFLNTQK